MGVWRPFERTSVSQEHLGDEEGVVFGEIAVVEDKQELAALIQCLNRTRDPGWEKSHVSSADIVNECFSLFIDGR